MTVIQQAISPRQYQGEAVTACYTAYTADAGRALVEMATGLGKSLVTAWLTQLLLSLNKNKNKRVLFLVDKIDPTDQGRANFERVLGNKYTMGTLHSKAGGWDNPGAQIIFSTYKTMASCLDLFKEGEVFLVIVDECHHAGAPGNRTVVEHFEALGAFLFGATATIERLDGVDIQEIFGTPVYSYPLSQALKDDKWLARVNYQVLHDNIDIKALRKLVQAVLKEGDRKVTRKDINNRLYLESELDDVVTKIKAHQGPETRTIIFCKDTHHAETVAARFKNAQTYHSKVTYLPGQETALERFRKGKLREIVVVNKLNEAIDIPEADLVVFIRSTASKRIWLQQLGRGLRRTDKKLYVTVLDFVANCERVIWIRQLRNEVRELPAGNDTDKPDTLVIGSDLFKVDFTQELLDVMSVLDQLGMNLYPTWEEAAAAARELGIQTGPAYAKKYEEDRRLPRHPDVKYSKVWTIQGGWPGFLHGTKLQAKYQTWKEASDAARLLGATSEADYGEKYKQDPRLHRQPNQAFPDAWIANGKWYGFLGTGWYTTWEEASTAARRIGFKDQDDYKARYKEDPRLPSNPWSYYSDVWKENGGLYGFLGKKQPVKKYKTWDEASMAARKLGATSSSQYKQRYKQDPQLPSSPSTNYAAVWKKNGNWRGFLGTTPYPTWEEASAAARSLGIADSSEYRIRYMEDRRLRSNPYKQYADDWKKNGSWDGFLGTTT